MGVSQVDPTAKDEIPPFVSWETFLTLLEVWAMGSLGLLGLYITMLAMTCYLFAYLVLSPARPISSSKSLLDLS